MSIKPVLAQAPSLGNGILCVARGKTDKGTKIYFYTSVIDDASIQRKRPVAVTIVESVTDIAEADVVIIDKEHQSITIDAFGAATPPQMQPVGLALTTYQGNNTFKGKSQAGTPLSFSLDNNDRVFKLQHGNVKYTGVCH
ncbi:MULTISPECIES: hypothetical protein [Microcystis]|uniref:hypothetical protein n=1 Tax=Microcystis TaxID=1125 RepID=UPI00232A8D9F|nr:MULTISPECIES: hypothetical protein [Microcystis]MDB9403238.1 hypothetical protein [Microcystis sp. CS-574]WOB68155.1 hypothetical protein PJW00_21965 [Microcystis aeruginosa LE3]